MARIRVAVIGVAVLALVAAVVPAVARSTAPPNDDFASATFVYEMPFAETVDNTAAGFEADERLPSCRFTQGTFWYAVAPSSDINLVARTSATFRNTMAVYQGTTAADLVETACSGGTTASKAEFRALAGNTYFIQIGSSGAKRGVLDFTLEPSVWQEKKVTQVDQAVERPGTSAQVVYFHGRPRASDPTMYDITVRVADAPDLQVGLLTFGLVKQEVKQELVTLPARSGRLVTTVSYRYDSSQYQCLVDGGEGSPCVAKSPIKDVNWLTSGDGQRAELVIRVALQVDEITTAERTIVIPFAGQLPGLLP